MMKLKAVKIFSYSLATTFLLGSTTMAVHAAPVAGITALATGYSLASDAAPTDTTALAGVSLSMATALSNNINAISVEVDSSAVVQTAAADYSDVAIAQVDNFVNVRSTPNEEGEVVGKLYNQSAASILSIEGDWYKISSGNVTGYVKTDFVVVGNEDLAKSVSSRIATVKADTLYVRTECSADASVLGMVPNGEDLTVVDESMLSDGWVKVAIEEGDGYVSSEYVALSTKYKLAESKAEEEARLAKEEAERQAAAAAAAAKQRAARAKAAAASSGGGGGGRTYAPASGGGGGAVVNYASQFVGNPYVYGGTSLTNGTDCSGFVMGVYGAYGVGLPHSSSAMRGVGYGVSADQMQPGDIVCYSGHVGIYAGNGQIVHASNARTGITYSNVNYRPIVTVRRIY